MSTPAKPSLLNGAAPAPWAPAHAPRDDSAPRLEPAGASFATWSPTFPGARTMKAASHTHAPSRDAPASVLPPVRGFGDEPAVARTEARTSAVEPFIAPPFAYAAPAPGHAAPIQRSGSGMGDMMRDVHGRDGDEEEKEEDGRAAPAARRPALKRQGQSMARFEEGSGAAAAAARPSARPGMDDMSRAFVGDRDEVEEEDASRASAEESGDDEPPQRRRLHGERRSPRRSPSSASPTSTSREGAGWRACERCRIGSTPPSISSRTWRRCPCLRVR